jgi:cystathionine beta-lyase/cystathionine gamma-synthase
MTMAAERTPGPASRGVHAGERRVDGALSTPIYRAAAFLYAPWMEKGEGAEDVWYYNRHGNPTVQAAEAKLSALVGSEDTLLTASGMGAITCAVLAHVRSGDHVVASRHVYGGARALLEFLTERFGVDVTWVGAETFAADAAAAAGPRTRLFYLESPTNPTLRLVDLPAAAAAAKRAGALTVLDHTFASPLGQDAPSMGIDLVVHACTKYVGGHSDLLAGSVSGRQELVTPVRSLHAVLGPVCDPQVAWLLNRGMKTLALRMERHHRNGLALARFLEGRPGVRAVHHPFLDSHPQRALARDQLRGGVGVLSFELADLETARRFVRALRLIAWAPSLGSVESLAHVPADRGGSHGHWTPEERRRSGVTDGLVRISAGVEEEADLLADLEQALAAL